MGVDKSWKELFDYLHNLQAGKEPYQVVGERLPALVHGLLLYDDGPQEHSDGLVHYTSWENMLKILDVEEGQHPLFRMYNYELANDPEEGDIKPPIWEKLEEKSNHLFSPYELESNDKKNRVESTYGCSFSTNRVDVEDDLMLWRLYGGDGNGCALKLGTRPSGIYRVRYIKRGQKNDEISKDKDLNNRLECLLQSADTAINGVPISSRDKVGRSIARAVNQILEGYFHLVKNDAYKHEQEWRIIEVNPDKTDVRFSVDKDRTVRRYIEGPKMKELLSTGSNITLGPRVANKNAASDYIEYLLRQRGMNYTKVSISTKKYRRS